VNFFRSLSKGAVAGDNPWEATTLEWSVAMKHDDPAKDSPAVYRGPYEYSVVGASKDFLMQDEF
jgi:cytochrome c oxidase subunit 1